MFEKEKEVQVFGVQWARGREGGHKAGEVVRGQIALQTVSVRLGQRAW